MSKPSKNSRSPNLSSPFFWTWAALIVIPMVIVSYKVTRYCLFVLESRQWVVTKGEVIEAKISRCEKSHCQLTVSYFYTVGNLQRVGRYIYPERENSFRRHEAETLMTRYHQSEKVQVYYDPNDYSRACLIAGQFDRPLMLDAAMVATFVITLALIAYVTLTSRSR